MSDLYNAKYIFFLLFKQDLQSQIFCIILGVRDNNVFRRFNDFNQILRKTIQTVEIKRKRRICAIFQDFPII